MAPLQLLRAQAADPARSSGLYLHATNVGDGLSKMGGAGFVWCPASCDTLHSDLQHKQCSQKTWDLYENLWRQEPNLLLFIR